VAPGPEAQFQARVVQYAQLMGWRVSHFKTSQAQSGRWLTAVGADGKGWPDLAMARERFLVAECKSATGTLSLEQKAWRDALVAAGVEWHLFRPRDWDAVVATLKRA
jgi:hypothetical protein